MEVTQFLAFLDPDEEALLLAEAPSKSFARDETILDQNVAIRAIFFIEDGSVRVERRELARTALLAVLGAGEFFGEMSFVDGAPTSARVVADAPTRLRVIDETTISKLLQEDADFMSRFYRSIAAILAERLRLTSMHLDCLIEGIDHYSRIRGEIEAATAKLPQPDWRAGLVDAVVEREKMPKQAL
jgi:CRP-like cAMP-binding protein